ncbi:hypothetical protein M758_UG340700 [Ceratodon purpureus]|nr:hypothetical protein M758_UG340700 [Ceratodon purpureus]
MVDELAKMLQISKEVFACLGVLGVLLTQLFRGPDPWDAVEWGRTRPWTPVVPVTFASVGNARAVSKLCKDQVLASPEYEVLASPEYAVLRLDPWEYDQENGVHWLSKDEH